MVIIKQMVINKLMVIIKHLLYNIYWTHQHFDKLSL